MRRFVGHHTPRILVVLVAGLIVLTLVPAPPSISWPVLAGLFVLVIALAVALFSHDRGLCERCIAAVPLEASAVASRYSARFRIAHRFERKTFAIGYLAAVVGSSFLYFDPVGRYAWAAAQGSLVYLLLVYTTHRRLQPWCPFCRSGGEEQLTPTAPTPVSSTR